MDIKANKITSDEGCVVMAARAATLKRWLDRNVGDELWIIRKKKHNEMISKIDHWKQSKKLS